MTTLMAANAGLSLDETKTEAIKATPALQWIIDHVASSDVVVVTTHGMCGLVAAEPRTASNGAPMFHCFGCNLTRVAMEFRSQPYKITRYDFLY
jgi:hypothetical protein